MAPQHVISSVLSSRGIIVQKREDDLWENTALDLDPRYVYYLCDLENAIYSPRSFNFPIHKMELLPVSCGSCEVKKEKVWEAAATVLDTLAILDPQCLLIPSFILNVRHGWHEQMQRELGGEGQIPRPRLDSCSCPT